MADGDGVQLMRFACHQCRARKLKCNRVRPCQRCSQLGEDCQYSETRQRPGHAPRRPKVKELQSRLTELEHRLKPQLEVEQNVGGRVFGDQAYAQVVPTGRLEQLPPQSVIDELTSIYFSRLYSDAPMQDPARYLDSLHRPPHMQPPICLQYAILAMAATVSPAHKELALPFYYRARNYIERDEMKGARQPWYARASMSVSRCVRLAQMLGLYDVEAVDGGFALAPANNWLEREERRRTMWAIFCTDRLSSSTTGWHPLVDIKKVRTLLPASEEAFRLGREESSLTLHEALGDASANLSPLACRVLAAHLFNICLEHTFTRYPNDDMANPQESEFWKHQQNLDNQLSLLFMVLPNSMRCPPNLTDHNAVSINLNLHTASICIHRVGRARVNGPSHHAHQHHGAAVRSLTAAKAIFAIIRGLSDPHLLFANPFVAFAAFMAAIVFADEFALSHNPQSEEFLNVLMDRMVAIADENLVTASLVMQLAEHMKTNGIDPHAVAKVSHLAAKLEADAFVMPMGLNNHHAGTVVFCPFQPQLQN
ncbi:hypothetical protein C7999DRAFT_40242 [Corynascus novoguineensis]|uniref:Zn(2)-C6 fungal-type domain-containing protein n=1 Tax=Corynascus novoguineensis TaxID=1126955 RepID=A0AAN7CUK6_9PEZI|nr:hypothetical protein C7999DRAFT_40242 [Corynascus novoguineensis]